MLWELTRTVPGLRGFLDLSRLVLAQQLCLWTGWPQRGRILPVHVRCLNGASVFCRIGTSDLAVLHATFVRQYHLPPTGLRGVTAILDLGSNVGLTMAHFAAVFPEARVLGIELDANNFELCRRNIAPFGDRCEVLHGAVWFQDGTVGYTKETQEGGQLTEAGYHVASAQQQVRESVRSWSVLGLTERLGKIPVDFVKCDIEGAEQVVIEAGETWLTGVRCLKVEVHPPYTVQDCVRALTRSGFDCYIDQNHPACVVAEKPAFFSTPRAAVARK